LQVTQYSLCDDFIHCFFSGEILLDSICSPIQLFYYDIIGLLSQIRISLRWHIIHSHTNLCGSDCTIWQNNAGYARGLRAWPALEKDNGGCLVLILNFNSRYQVYFIQNHQRRRDKQPYRPQHKGARVVVAENRIIAVQNTCPARSKASSILLSPAGSQPAGLRRAHIICSDTDHFHIEFPIPRRIKLAKINTLPRAKYEFSVVNDDSRAGTHC